MPSVLSRLVVLVALSGSPRFRALSIGSAKKHSVPFWNASSNLSGEHPDCPTTTITTTTTTGNSQPAATPVTMGWSRTASVQSNGDVSLETIAEEEISVAGRALDLRQSVDWMEYLELTEQRQNDEGGAGAYDTMRCDVLLSKTRDGQGRLRIWGQDYHLQRLERSYLSLMEAKMEPPSKGYVYPPIDRALLKDAMQRSKDIISKLLEEAESSVSLANLKDDASIQLFRVTLLWSSARPKSETDHSILVRGHATSSGQTFEFHRQPDPIVVSVATHSPKTEADVSSSSSVDDETLPTRYANPQSKIASWCRQRKQMERPDTFKPPGVSEVLMVRPRLDEGQTLRLEVLEGLSSNFFVIYKDGTLRTATEGVLDGYVRHLVLGCASKVGLKLDPRPIFLHESSEWKEAFITSSSRLIYPISKVLLPEEEPESNSQTSQHKTQLVAYWTADGDESPKWQDLLNAILAAGGYDSVEHESSDKQ